MGYLSQVPTLGDNIRQLRKKLNLRGYELARRMDVSPPVMSAWENDRGGLPELETVFRLANALECSIEELVDGVDPIYSDRMTSRRQAEAGRPATTATDRADGITDAAITLARDFDQLDDDLKKAVLVMVGALRARLKVKPPEERRRSTEA